MTLAQVVEILPWRLLLYVLCTVGALLAIVRRQRNTLGQQAEYSRRLQQEVAKRTDELRTQNRELAALNHKLQEVSVTDSLTGLWNRRYLSNEIEKELALMRRARLAKKLDERTPDADLLFLIMDVDGLKGVNDTYGHQAGDLAILQMKEILVRVCRQSDTLIRWGGDEFLLLGRQAGRDSAAHLAERIRQAVADHRFDFGDGDTLRLSCSIGFAFLPFMSSTPNLFSWEQVLDMADRALYRAKQTGRNRWVGVLSAPGADPVIFMKRKDDDLEQLARDGIIELYTRVSPLTSPDDTARHAPSPSHPHLVRTG